MKISRCQIPTDLIGYIRGLKRNGIYKIVVCKERVRNNLVRRYVPLEGLIIRLTHFQKKKIRFEIITSEKAYLFPADKFLRFKGMAYEALRYIELEPYDPKRLPLFFDRATDGFQKVMETV